MASFVWRGNSGAFGTSGNWSNATTGENPATTAPGTADIATLAAANSPTGLTVTGSGAVDTLNVTPSSSVLAQLNGQFTAGTVNIGGAASLLSGAALTLGGSTTGGGVVSVGTANGFASLGIGSGSRVGTTVAPQAVNYLFNIGNGGTTGSVVVSGTGVLDMGGNAASVGLTGTGTLTVNSGGTARLATPDGTPGGTAALAIGRQGTGTVLVTGSGSTMTLGGAFYAGRATGSTGSLTVTAGASLVQAPSTANDTATNAIGSSGVVNGAQVTGGTGSLTVSAGATATLANQTLVGTNGARGTLTVTGSGSVLRDADTLYVGGGNAFSGGSGTLSVLSGGVVQVTAAGSTARSYLQVGNSGAGTGAVTVDGAGSLLDVGQNGVSLGNGGTGTFTVSGGATARSGTIDGTLMVALGLGNATGSSGQLTVTGAGSSYDAAGYAYVGRGGTGTLNLDQGGAFTGGSAPVGNGTGANAGFGITIGDGSPGSAATPYFAGSGTATVLNGSTLRSRNAIFVGNRGGTGTLTLNGGSTALADTVVNIGTGTDRTGASGTVGIQGGSTLRSGGVHARGSAGISLGVQAGTTGSVTVSGAGSLLDANGDRITVGSRGAGTLTVSGGARALAGAAYTDTEAAFAVGAAAGATGSVTVTGSGSQLVASGLAVLGGNNSGAGLASGGTGQVSVSDGGLFRAGTMALFANSAMTVSGTGTAVLGSSAGAAGKLTIDAGSSLSGAGAVQGNVLNNGLVNANGSLLTISQVDSASTGTFMVSSGTLDITVFGGHALAYGGAFTTIRTTTGVAGNSVTVTGFAAGDVLDFARHTDVTLSGNTVSLGGSPYVFQGLQPGTALSLASDGNGGTKVVGTNILFDARYYLAQNPDVAQAGIDPYQHYVTTGFKEGRNPSTLFDDAYYLTQNPDVQAAGLNPLLHFEGSGWTEGRNPSAGFDVRDYLAANPDVKAAGLDPLIHYAIAGRAEGRAAFTVSTVPKDPLLDAAYYYATNPDVKAAGIDANAHYAASGYKEGRNPNAFFDSRYYLTQNPDVKAAGLNPLQHFEATGYKEGRQPSLVFDDAKYLDANMDVKAAGLNPLAHYLSSGRSEGRQAFITGGRAPADPLVDAAYYDAQLGATLLPTGTAAQEQAAFGYDATGWQKGLNPDAFFDTGYYLAHNPDVAAAHINPLAHYEANGWHEGRDASARFSTSRYLAAYADVRNAGIDPLLHYVVNGQAEGRTAFPV